MLYLAAILRLALATGTASCFFSATACTDRFDRDAVAGTMGVDSIYHLNLYLTLQIHPFLHLPLFSSSLEGLSQLEEVLTKPVAYYNDTIIIACNYRPNCYNSIDMQLQDMDFIIVNKQKNEPFIRYCDVIFEIIRMELKGEIKPNHGLFLQGLERVNFNRIPMYRIRWGS
jgi:hypothetical protein